MRFQPEELADRCTHLIAECLYVASVYRFQAKLWESYAYDDAASIAKIKRKRHRERANKKAAAKALKIRTAIQK